MGFCIATTSRPAENILDIFHRNILDVPCTCCGKCCTHREDILLNPRDVYNMSRELGMSPEKLVKKYCEVYAGEDSRVPIVRVKPKGHVKSSVHFLQTGAGIPPQCHNAGKELQRLLSIPIPLLGFLLIPWKHWGSGDYFLFPGEKKVTILGLEKRILFFLSFFLFPFLPFP